MTKAKQHSFDIAGRTAFVSGGSAGIGLALVQEMLAAGIGRIFIVGRNREKLALAHALAPDRIVPLQFDLADQNEVNRMIADLPALAPDLSFVVNNAGILVHSDPAAQSTERLLADVRREVSINLLAAISISYAALPLLARNTDAAVVNVSSGLALAPKRRAPVYCATKSGLRAFTRAFRYQCEEAFPQVRVMEALPPLVDTSLAEDIRFAKMSAESCAAEMLAGIRRSEPEILIGASRDLFRLTRRAPQRAYALMRDR